MGLRTAEAAKAYMKGLEQEKKMRAELEALADAMDRHMREGIAVEYDKKRDLEKLKAGDYVRLHSKFYSQDRYTDAIVLSVDAEGISGRIIEQQKDGTWGFQPGTLKTDLTAAKLVAHEPHAAPDIVTVDSKAREGLATDAEKLALHTALNRFMKERGEPAIEKAMEPFLYIRKGDYIEATTPGGDHIRGVAQGDYALPKDKSEKPKTIEYRAVDNGRFMGTWQTDLYAGNVLEHRRGFLEKDIVDRITNKNENGPRTQKLLDQAFERMRQREREEREEREKTRDEQIKAERELPAPVPDKSIPEKEKAAPSNEKEKHDFREELTQRMAAEMEKGILPWDKPWRDGPTPALGAARNPATGTIYSGGNRLHLTLAALNAGYSSNEWCTFKQAQEQGWQVRKGEKATHIERWQETPFYKRKGLDLDIRAAGSRVSIESESRATVTLTNGKEVSKADIVVTDKSGKTMGFAEASHEYNLRFARTYAVFNLDQMDGPVREPKTPATSKEMHARLQTLVRGMQADGLKLETGGNRGFYRPSEDKIQVPKPDQFKDLPSYYSTLLHEMGHATGAAHRLNRPGITTDHGGFGSPTYAKEELVAELTSFFAAAETGIPRKLDTEHAAYLQSWAKELREDKNALFRAAKEAGQAVDYMIEKEKVLELAKDKVIATPNLHHGLTDGPVLAVDKRADVLLQDAGKMAVVHKREVAPDAKPGDELRVTYRNGFGQAQDLGPIRERERDRAKAQAKDAGMSLEIKH